MLTRTLLALALVTSAAYAEEGEPTPAPDPARPAVGEWVGGVSWNDPPVSYAWFIYPDGTFESGRLGRGAGGAGAWGVHDGRLVLKYADGFRYEGELRGGAYGGNAYRANGRVFGQFAMSRAAKYFDAIAAEENP